MNVMISRRTAETFGKPRAKTAASANQCRSDHDAGSFVATRNEATQAASDDECCSVIEHYGLIGKGATG